MQGPQVLTVPTFDVPNRYWIVQFSDLYMNFFAAVGYSYNSSGSYLVVGRSKVLSIYCDVQLHRYTVCKTFLTDVKKDGCTLVNHRLTIQALHTLRTVNLGDKETVSQGRSRDLQYEMTMIG